MMIRITRGTHLKRKRVTLVLIVLAVSSNGAARRRAVGPIAACAALTPQNLSVRYTGSLSGCATGNSTQCQIGESITFQVSTLAYDAGCGEHQVVMRFGDTKSESRTVKGQLPSFQHAYASAGGYALEATVSNGHSSVKSSQMLMVSSYEDGDGIY